MASDPLQQFVVTDLFAKNVLAEGEFMSPFAFTNSSLWMILLLVTVSGFLLYGIRRHALVPGRWQSLVELSYEFIANMLSENVGAAGRKYFPFVFTLFMFVFFGNMLGMLPYSFTVTSHIIVTFALSMAVFILVTVIGLVKHGTHFFSLFLPEGTPLWMAPIMIPIEIISYLSRPMSLSIRLAANMMAGHAMLKVIAGFIFGLGLFGIFPLGFVMVLIVFELLVAFLQAYIFTILTCVYLSDAIHLH